ncbi:MAG TPA: protein kinase [Candidatus Obscuribacterales bacterium]
MNGLKEMDITEAAQKDMIRVLVVEDQEVLRLGLKLTLQYMRNLSVVGEACDGPSAVERALALKPQVVLMDIGLPGFDGIEATRQIKKQLNTKVMILTSHEEDKSIFAALEAGADGYCLKDISSAKLATAINSVASGAAWLDDDIARKVLHSAKMQNPEVTSERLALSERELKVLGLILEGASSTEIGNVIGLQESQVQAYLKKLIQKLSFTGTSTKTGLSTIKPKSSGDFQRARVCTACHSRMSGDFERCPYDGHVMQDDEFIGSMFADRYEILALLGAGTGGAVYKARHRYMNKLVAIKIMHLELIADLSLLKRFRQEAAAASSLNHPNIVSVIDFGLSPEGQAFMIMDYLGGKSLDAIIVEEGRLPDRNAVPLFLQICEGLGHAHANGIIHRDLKPSNVLVVNYGSQMQQVKLVDFGTAKLVTPDNNAGLTVPGQVFGSPTYMSPEQCMGLPLEASSDIYSMGCLMYEALAGQPPFVTDNIVEAMYKQVHEEVPPLAKALAASGLEVNPRLQAIVMKTLRKDKYQRHQSMVELKRDLIGLAV